MIVRILSRKFCILSIFIISLLICITIPAITSVDLDDQNHTNENNHTITTIDEHTSPSSDNVLSDSNSETISTDELPIVENDVPTIVENKTEVIDEILTTTPSSQAADPQPNDESQQTTPPSTKRNLSNINSFEEWKQQQLHADLLKKGEIADRNSVSSDPSLTGTSKETPSSSSIQQIASTTGSSKKGKLRKNFASSSCGAKLLAHNTEAQNVASILSSSPDEYMLNPCNAKIWFVIELCESIRILNIEIANFELFSSVPKTFRVSASDRYPTKDWHRHHLGTFNASFNRTVQSFQTIESTTYLKYVKFELLDFHGHEHYCPLSVVRIHGSNVEDEIMTMEDNTNLNDLKTSSNIPDENDDENDDLSNDQQVGGIIGSAILDLAKRVFRRPTTRGTTSTTTIPMTETIELKPHCHPTNIHGSITNQQINSWKQSDTFKQCLGEFLTGLWSEFDTCTIYLTQICFKSNYCCQCPLSNNRTNKNNLIISTINLYINPCGYYHILTNQLICRKEKLIESNKTIEVNINSELTQDSGEKNLTLDKNDTGISINESTNSSNDQTVSIPNNTLPIESQIQSTPERSVEQTFSSNISNETVAPEPQIPLDTTDQSSAQSSQIETMTGDFNITEPLMNTIDEIITTTTTTVLTTTASSSTVNNNNNNEAMPPIISSPWLKGMLVNTKSLPELFKIIEKLNFNLTLSNRYLQELSQHYVKKLDETQQTTDLLLKASNIANEKFENLEKHLYELQENYNDISYRLIKLEAWIPLIVSIIFCMLVWLILSTWRLSRLRRKYKYLLIEHEKFKVKETEKDDDADDTEERPIIPNGILTKRKLSTDSTDSNPNRSQRVPDSTLTKIKENGIHKAKRKSSTQTQHILSLSTINT